jgi:Ser/Thr protein kinase RdoA (MazF antagonist)
MTDEVSAAAPSTAASALGHSEHGDVFPVTHSNLATDALVTHILSRYDVGEVTKLRLHHRGLTDTYLVETENDRYALRAYRTGWRTDDDVRYELDALTHLHQRGVPVSYPLADREGRIMQRVQAPEGHRQVVLFTYAPGGPMWVPPNEKRNDYHYRYGRVVATIHAATDDFSSTHQRFRLDLHELIDRQMEAIRPLLAHRAADWTYLTDLAARVKERVRKLPIESLETGFCHGDLHGGNCHVDGDTLTFFDFDCCGPGWRAYDVSVFLWSGALNGRPRTAKRRWRQILRELVSDAGEYLRERRLKRRWREFLRGYREVRPFAGVDLEAVPLFVAIRQLWLLGLHTGNGSDWGYAWMNDRYFDRQLKFLRGWEQARLEKPLPRWWR